MNFLGGVNLFKAKIFLLACLIFIAGIGLASFLPEKLLPYKIWWFTAAVFFLVLAVWLGRLKIAFLLLAVFCLAVWRYGLSLPADAPNKIWRYNDKEITAKGWVANEPDVRENSQKLEIETESAKELPGRKIFGKILVTTSVYPEYKYGDRLELTCRLERPEKIKDFSYDRYLARYRIYSVCYFPEIKILSGQSGNWFYPKIFAVKAKLAGLIDSGLSEPESSLARPIVFGGARGLEQTIRDNFQKVGLTHIMAVSGFNVSILAVIVMAVMLGVGVSRKYAFYLAVALLAVYIILVGLPASAMRAGLMGFLVLWALKLGRLNKITNSLVLAAVILLIINPKLLRDDVGFQLSFLAIAGLVYVYPILEAVWQKIKLPKLKGVSDGLLITLAAQVFTLPVLAYNFSQISLIAPLANLAVLWTLPVLTILILIALPLSAFLPGWSFLFFLPSLILTKYILMAVKIMAGWPFSFVETGYLWPGWMGVYYATVIWGVVKLNKLLLISNNGKIVT